MSSSVDAEIYANNSELSDAANRKRAALEMKYVPFRLLTVSLNVTHFETNYPSELVPTTGLHLVAHPGDPARHHPGGDLPDHVGRYRDGVVRVPSRHAGRRPRQRYPPGEARIYARQLTPVDAGFINDRLHVFESQGKPATITNTPTLG